MLLVKLEVTDLDVELQVGGGDHTVALELCTCLAVMALPVVLDGIDSIEHLAVSPVDAPHAHQGLELGHCPLPLCIGLQRSSPLLLQHSQQGHLPPALDDAGPESHVQQRAAHQGATPPGLDLYGCCCFFFL